MRVIFQSGMRAITPTLAEVNQLSRFDLTATFHKQGKAVVEIDIGWNTHHPGGCCAVSEWAF
jgi:hypothetical protein